MAKTTLVVDEKKVAKAKEILGAKSLRETVDRALDEVIAASARERALARLRGMEGLELDRPEVLEEAWR